VRLDWDGYNYVVRVHASVKQTSKGSSHPLLNGMQQPTVTCTYMCLHFVQLEVTRPFTVVLCMYVLCDPIQHLVLGVL
jgi:hypothetical protein